MNLQKPKDQVVLSFPFTLNVIFGKSSKCLHMPSGVNGRWHSSVFGSKGVSLPIGVISGGMRKEHTDFSSVCHSYVKKNCLYFLYRKR